MQLAIYKRLESQRTPKGRRRITGLNGELTCYLVIILVFVQFRLPLDQVLSLYCHFLSRTMTPESVRNYLSGVKLLHIILGESVSQFLAYEIKIALRGIERLARHIPSRAPTVSPELLLAIARTCNSSNARDVVLLCAFSFTFFPICQGF